MYKNIITLKTDKDIRVLLDPYRQKILQIYRDHKDPLTVMQVADIMGEPHGKVYYHVKKLLNTDLLEVVKTETVNGIIAKYYKRKYDAIYYDSVNVSNSLKEVHNSTIESSFDTCVNEFRKNIQVNLDKFGESSESPKDITNLVFQDLYLSQEDYEEFVKSMREIISKYTAVDETKGGHSLLMALARVE